MAMAVEERESMKKEPSKLVYILVLPEQLRTHRIDQDNAYNPSPSSFSSSSLSSSSFFSSSSFSSSPSLLFSSSSSSSSSLSSSPSPSPSSSSSSSSSLSWSSSSSSPSSSLPSSPSSSSSSSHCPSSCSCCSSSTSRYTQSILQSALQLMGCKPRHSFKISERVFEMLASESSSCQFSRNLSDSEFDNNRDYSVKSIKRIVEENGIRMDQMEKTLILVQRKRFTVVISRGRFLDVVCKALSEYRYIGPNQRADLSLACRIRERKMPMLILLCGTSGCGKSTLSTLLASRLGITTVVSTDSIRHMMRSFIDERENPLLWASTYHAGDYLDPLAVAESKGKKKARKMERGFLGSRINLAKSLNSEEVSKDPSSMSMRRGKPHVSLGKTINGEIHEGDGEIIVSEKMLAVKGYKAQSEMVIDSLDRLITSWEQKCESVIIEGVHLSINFVMGLMKKHPSIIPFMIFIANEEKHIERFAVRAKYMALDPSQNKYVKYIRNIRAIQDYLCKRADKYLVPKVNNTNIDRSINAIHATIFSCMRRRDAGDQLFDPVTNTMRILNEEYQNQCKANSFGSKVMLQLIQRRGRSCQIVALVNGDGSVARAWPFDASYNGDASECGRFSSLGMQMYGSFSIGNAQPVNLQFGKFGLSAFTNDLEGTSHTSSIDGLCSKGDGTEADSSSCVSSSCSSSLRLENGPNKEVASENIVSETEEEEEEADDGVNPDSDEDLDINNKQLEEDGMEGSVDEESIRSDEDEIMDGKNNAYCLTNCIENRNAEKKLDLVLTHGSEQSDDMKHYSNSLYSHFLKHLSRDLLHIPNDDLKAYMKFKANEILGCKSNNGYMAHVGKQQSHNRSKSLPFLEPYGYASYNTIVIGNGKV